MIQLRSEQREVFENHKEGIIKTLSQKPKGYQIAHDSVCYTEESKYIDSIYYEDFIECASVCLSLADEVIEDPDGCDFPTECCWVGNILFGAMHGQGTLYFARVY